MATHHQRVAQQDKLLPHAVDLLAAELPNAEYGEWVTASEVTAITYSQLANIVNGLSWSLVEQLGGSGHSKPQREVLAYVGPNDVRYSALVLAAIKAGYTLFVTSPRNSPLAQQSLFKHLNCQTLITTDPATPPALGVLNAVSPAKHMKIPSLKELLAKEYPHFKLEKMFEEIKADPFVVMHTSGTTGVPKPIIWTHETCALAAAAKNEEAPKTTSTVEGLLLNGKRIVVTLPPFHGALLAQLMVGAIPFGNVVIAPAAAPIPTGQGIVDVLKQTPADAAILVPSVVAEIAQSPELLEYASKNLKAILYIGGDLPQEIGDRVAEKLYLRCQWGATETGIVPQLLPSELLPSSSSSSALWRYVSFHPCVGAVFDKITDDTFEMVVQRDDSSPNRQTCFSVPGIDGHEYRTKDLFTQHPEIPDLWRWCARADDIIVFLNGEKTNPISMEQHIVARNKELSGALVIGAKRFQAALLVEPASEELLSNAEQAALIERIWPSVEEANKSAPGHARIEKSFILIVPANRRLIKAGKGTYMRAPSIAQYHQEIERLYSVADETQDSTDGNKEDTPMYALGSAEITRRIRKHALLVTGWTSLEDTDNFFERGMDSLQGLQLSRALKRSLNRTDLALSTLYQNASVAQLSAKIIAGDNDFGSEEDVMRDLFATYRGLIQDIPKPTALEQRNGRAAGLRSVLLTGSTGTVGTQLLHTLLQRDGVDHVYCLNRGKDGGNETQRKSFKHAGFPTTAFDDKRVTFIKADLSQPLLGLATDVYQLLQSHVGLIIHAAWPVNFNLDLLSFRPQLAGIVNLATLAAGSSARLIFISSVAAVEGNTDGPPPEQVLQSFDTPAAFGYGRAKFLCELLVEAATQHFGSSTLPTTIIRVGQVGGTISHPGIWNIREWLPSMVISSLHLGKISDSLGSRFNNVDFVPADVLSDVLVDLATTATKSEGTAVFNIRNPHLVSWKELLPAIMEAASQHDRTLEAVTPSLWLAEVGSEENAVAQNPAAKLVDFYTSLWAADLVGAKGSVASFQPMAVDKALAASPTLRDLQAVNLQWMRKWANEWFASVKAEQ